MSENLDRARAYQLTLPATGPKSMPLDEIQNNLRELHVDYFCLSEEIGLSQSEGSEDGTGYHHTHVYLYRSGAIRFTTLKKSFPTAHIEAAFKTPEANRAYIFKSGTKMNKDDQGFYEYTDKKGNTHKGQNLIDTHVEWGELKSLQKLDAKGFAEDEKAKLLQEIFDDINRYNIKNFRQLILFYKDTHPDNEKFLEVVKRSNMYKIFFYDMKQAPDFIPSEFVYPGPENYIVDASEEHVYIYYDYNEERFYMAKKSGEILGRVQVSEDLEKMFNNGLNYLPYPDDSGRPIKIEEVLS